MKVPPGQVEIRHPALSALKTGPAPEAVLYPIWPHTERAKPSSWPQTVVQERPCRPGTARQGVQGSSSAPSLGSAKGRKVSTPRPQRASSVCVSGGGGGRTAEPVSAPEQTLWPLGLPAPLTVAPPLPRPEAAREAGPRRSGGIEISAACRVGPTLLIITNVQFAEWTSCSARIHLRY